MRIEKLNENIDFETFNEFEDMDLSDALFALAELVEDDKLEEYEIDIIDEMFDKLLSDETDATTKIEEMQQITTTFKKSKASDRIKNRIKQRKRRRSPSYKIKQRNRRKAAKRCGRNQTPQLVKPGGTTYRCKLKNRFRSKLMKRVAKAYHH